jgi:hypothetical protein
MDAEHTEQEIKIQRRLAKDMRVEVAGLQRSHDIVDQVRLVGVVDIR